MSTKKTKQTRQVIHLTQRKQKITKLILPTVYCSAIFRNSTFFILDDAMILDEGFQPLELSDVLHEKKENGDFIYPQLLKESTQRRGVFFCQAKSQQSATTFLQNVRIPTPTTIAPDEIIYEFDNKILVKFKNNIDINYIFNRISTLLSNLQNSELLKAWNIETNKYIKIPKEEEETNADDQEEDTCKKAFNGITLMHENYRLAFGPLFYPVFVCAKIQKEEV